MEAEIDPQEFLRETKALGRSLVAGEPVVVGAGFYSEKSGMFGFGEREVAVMALAPPQLIVQRIEEGGFTRVGPPVTISASEVEKASFETMDSPSRKDSDPLAIFATLKLSEGPKVKLEIVHGGLYGNEGDPQLRANAVASCDAIVSWLKDPR